MKTFALTLLGLGRFWILASCLVGCLSAGLWARSQQAWAQHLNTAFLAGVALQDSLRHGTALPEGLTATPLSAAENAIAADGRFAQVSGLPMPVYLTSMSLTWQTKADASPDMRIVIASQDLVYEISGVEAGRVSAGYDKLGQVTRLLASVCSDPVLLVQHKPERWLRISGNAVWGCAAAPRDLRLWVIGGAFLMLCMLLAHVSQTSESFTHFSSALRNRNQIMGVDRYDTAGPSELRETIETVNAYLEAERRKLENRILLFSGMSHDLGTPAARLRLRAALINDDALRAKFESDIDQMSDMINGMLVLAQSEVSTEPPRPLSLSTLVEAIVSDFQDTGQPVVLEQAPASVVEGGSSVFSTRKARNQLQDTRHVLINAGPVLLRRALSNLIENAVKYGRKAVISMHSDVDFAEVRVEDAGEALSAAQLNALIGPFKRGENSSGASGVGLGLTVTSTIAQLHGGELSFEQGARGIIARFTILRDIS